MSKKIYLLIIIFAPLIIGYLHNWVTVRFITIPILFIINIYWYGSPILMAYFWFWAGGKFAQSNIKIFYSILFGNIAGIVSLFIYFWQFVYTPPIHRNAFLAATSMYFSSIVSIYLARLARLFEPNKNHIGMVTLNAMEIIGLMFMIIIFTLGYCYKKRKLRMII